MEAAHRALLNPGVHASRGTWLHVKQATRASARGRVPFSEIGWLPCRSFNFRSRAAWLLFIHDATTNMALMVYKSI